MTRRRIVLVSWAAVLAAASLVVAFTWRPWDPVPDELRTAADRARDVPGVVSVAVDYEVVMRDPKDGDAALARFTIRLDAALAPADAGASARVAAASVVRADVPGTRALERRVIVQAGAPRSVNGIDLYPVDVGAGPGRAEAVSDAFTLWRAGATSVRSGTVEAADGDTLVRLADLAADRGIIGSFATADGTIRYDTYGGPLEPAAVRLAVDAAARPGVDGAIYVASTEPHLQVSMTTRSDSPEDPRAHGVARRGDRRRAPRCVPGHRAGIRNDPRGLGQRCGATICRHDVAAVDDDGSTQARPAWLGCMPVDRLLSQPHCSMSPRVRRASCPLPSATITASPSSRRPSMCAATRGHDQRAA